MTTATPADPGHASTAHRRRIPPTSSWSLRRRLLVVLACLFALLTLVIAIASVTVMSFVLTDRRDADLRELADGTLTVAQHELQPGCLGELGVGNERQPFDSLFAVLCDGSVEDSLVLTFPSGQEALSPADAFAIERLASTAVSSIDLPDRGEYRVVLLDVHPGVQIAVGMPLDDVKQELAALAFVIAVAALAAIVVVVTLGDTIIRRALRPLTAVIATTERISQLPLAAGEVQLTNRVAIDDPATEVGRVSESVNRMIDHVESALAARSESERKVRQFVADASHELRTPLAAVRGYAEVMQRHEQGLSAEGQQSVERIQAASHRMQTLVDDLLLLARLDEGRELQRSPIDLSRLVVDAVADAQAAGRAHPISLDLPEEPIEITGDLLRLQQVIGNLLTNARVHTPEGTAIDVALRETGSEAIIDIVDHGPGIPEELRATMFERFVRGDASRSRAAGSSGLGLAIVRAIVQAHAGSIELESKPGTTAFRVRLPLGRARSEDV